MATKTIGSSSRDYATVALWISYLVGIGTLAAQEIGECYADSEFTTTATIDFTGFTPSSGKEAILRPATGQGFKDNASVQTNALRYNASNGVAFRKTNGYNPVFTISVDYVLIRGLQIQHVGGGNNDITIYNASTTNTHSEVSRCILNTTSTANSRCATMRSGLFNANLVIMGRSGAGDGVNLDYAGTLVVIGNTVVRPSDKTAAGDGFSAASGSTTLTNNAIFGFTNSVNNTGRFAGSNNASDVAIGFGTSNQASKTYANQFVNTAVATADFKVKDSSADIFNNGATSSTYDATDIVGTARPQSTSYDIGCWELITASAYTLTAGTGAYTVTGVAAGLKVAHKVTAATGSYTLTGVATGLYVGRKVAAVAGSYTLTGVAAGLRATRLLTSAAGSYTVTGNAAGLLRGLKVTAAAGSYTLTGVAAGLRATRLLTAGAGSYTVTGNAAGLLVARKLTAATGAYVVSGQNAILVKTGSYLVVASPGSYVITGVAAGLKVTRKITAAAGAFVLTGQNATLSYSNEYTTVVDPLYAVNSSRTLKLPSSRRFIDNSSRTFSARVA